MENRKVVIGMTPCAPSQARGALSVPGPHSIQHKLHSPLRWVSHHGRLFDFFFVKSCDDGGEIEQVILAAPHATRVFVAGWIAMGSVVLDRGCCKGAVMVLGMPCVAMLLIIC